MVNLIDVAKYAGVSKSTVSNFVNGRVQTMGVELQERVQRAIADLGYKPNLAARYLRTGLTPLIGLLVPNIEYPSWSRLARELETILQKKYRFRLVVGNTYRDPQNENSFLADLLSHGIRGVIVVSPLLDQENFEEAVKRGLIVVGYDQVPESSIYQGVDFVSIDHFEAAATAVRYLFSNGHRHLAFVTASGESESRQKKIDGFLYAVNQANIHDTSQIIQCRATVGYGDDEMPRLGYEAGKRIAKQRNPPTAILALNDMLAIGLISGLSEAGLVVPNDVSIIGIDDLLLSNYISPGITSMSYPIKKLASKMVERIMLRLENPLENTSQFIFPTKIVERNSVARIS